MNTYIRGMTLGLLATTCLGLGASPALAQQQTIAGAQQFLTELAHRGSLVWRMTESSDGKSGSYFSAYVEDTRAPEECVTIFRLGRKSYMSGVSSYVEGSEFAVDWRKVNRVEAAAFMSGTQVSVGPSVVPAWPYLGFDADSKDMNTRLAFAMNFLRTNCDTTAGTGF